MCRAKKTKQGETNYAVQGGGRDYRWVDNQRFFYAQNACTQLAHVVQLSIGGYMKDKVIYVRVTEKFKERVQDAADRINYSISDYVVMCINQHLEQKAPLKEQVEKTSNVEGLV